MKNLKLYIGYLGLILFSLSQWSCEDNESGVDLIGLEARFISEVTARTVVFTNVSNDATSYLWDFGDNTTSTAANPTKVFDNGTFTVTLTAFDEQGDTASFEQTYTINCETDENIDPAANNLNWTFLNSNGNSAFDAFGGLGGGIVLNPVQDAVNGSCSVFLYNKLAGCQVWSGAGYGLSTPLDFATMTDKVFTLKVLAETQVTDVTLLLEFMPFPNNNPFQQRTATISQTGVWEELTFDFSNVNTGTFQNLVIYFERNAPCDGDIYYFDDLIQQ